MPSAKKARKHAKHAKREARRVADYEVRVQALVLSDGIPYTPQEVYRFLTAKDPLATPDRQTGFQSRRTVV